MTKREISWKSRFKNDYKREKNGKYREELDIILGEVFEYLVSDTALPQRYNDHKLLGKWTGLRECHVKPDLLLIYRKPSAQILELYRLGSHSELRLA